MKCGMTEYRVLTPDDYDAVSALWNSIEGMGLRSLDDSREGIDKYLRRNPSTSFIALSEGRAVGCVLCGHDGRRGYIYHTCVLPEFRGQGIGSRLVGLALSALAAEGINKCALLCFCSNETGNGFWRAEGWELRKDINYFNLTLNKNNI